jgi:hypothetical protein
MFNIALGIFLFLSPIFFIPFAGQARLNGIIGALQFYQFGSLSLKSGIIQLQFFQYGILFLFMVALMQNSIRSFKNRDIAFLLGLCMLSVIFHPKTVSVFTPVFLGFLLYYLTVKYTKDIRPFMYIIFSVSVLNTLFAILQFFNIHLLYNPASIHGAMFSPSHLGSYQALALPISYSIHPLLVFIPLTGLVLSKSATPLLAGAIGMVYLLHRKKGKFIILGIISLGIIGNFHNILYKLALRLNLWRLALLDIIKRPLLGYGIDTFSKTIPPQGTWQWTYNEFLGVAFSIGLLSWIFIYRFLRNKFSGISQGLERTICASCLIATIIFMGQPALHFARLAGTIIILFAFWEILKGGNNNEDKIYRRA